MALPGLPNTERGVQLLADRSGWTAGDTEGTAWRRRAGRGGGVEYHHRVLPLAAKVRLVMNRALPAPEIERREVKTTLAVAEMWRWFEKQPAKRQAVAKERLEALDAVEALVASGVSRTEAYSVVSGVRSVALRTLYEWAQLVALVDRADWLPFLAPRYSGGGAEKEITHEAWEMLKADWLRPEKPNAADCIRRVRAAAAERDWTLPGDRTLIRRLNAIDPAIITLRREGERALKRMIPAQQRDRSVLHALEAVNADGHTFDVFARWPDGTIARPVIVPFQDIYSGRVLSWRVDVSENWHAVRLAFGDLVESYGIPDHCVFDNGRHFGSKKLTGGQKSRFRFKIRDDDPSGILTTLGVQVHWATPYSGQSKPIERAFRDWAQSIAKHPAFAGAYTGNSPQAKPENYGSKAVPIEKFLEIIAAGIVEHNTRIGRTGGVCRGRSFEEVFNESYAKSPIRKATEEQRRLWLLAADGVSVNRVDGTVELYGNRWWAEWLWAFRGGKVMVRYDPEYLHQPLHVYRLDGAYLGAAELQQAAGFFDVDAAQRHNRKRRALMNAIKAKAAAEAALKIEEVAAMLPAIERAEAEPPAPRVLRPLFGAGGTALQARHEPQEQEEEEGPDALLAALRKRREAGGRPALHVIHAEEEEAGNA
nr:transposase domain-containing protein [Plastoroseomonas hellenica]